MSYVISQQLGNYRLIKLLGQGRFASVYLGEHIQYRTQVAIKMLNIRLTGQEVEYFRNIALSIMGLEHPNIVRVYDSGIADYFPYIVMAYVPDGSLRTFHPSGTRLDPFTIVSYVRQIASALQHAHNENVIHRDIKPANMLPAKNYTVLLSDFSIAYLYQSVPFQNEQNTIETVSYMAPEQLQGEAYPATDQYALGTVVYEWLSGEHPFHGTFAELCNQIAHTLPPPLSEKVPGIPASIEKVLMTALAKNPQQRFASVQDFGIALEEACAIDPTLPFNPAFALPDSSRPAGPRFFHEAIQPTFTPAPLPASVNGPISPAPVVPLQREMQSQRRFSRRAMLVGLGGLAGLAVVGGGIGTWLAFFRKSPTGTLIYVYHGHTDDVYDAEWSPDGKRISSASNDISVQIWDATSGKQDLIYRGHTSGVRSAAWAPDGKRIASDGYDHTVQIWDTVSGSPLLTYRGHTDTVWRVAWSPDGQYIASASQDGTVQIWDSTTGRRILSYHGHGSYPIRAVAWSPDGQRIASGSYDHTVQVWDATSGNKDFVYLGHTNWVATVAWSPDGKRIASGGYDHTAQVWDAASGAHIYTYQGHAVNNKNVVPNVNSVAWSPDGQRIASGAGDHTTQIWDAITGANAYTYQGHNGWVYSVAWSPDGQLIASGATDKTVQVWRAV